MSRKNRSLLRTLFAVPSAMVLVFGATQALASPSSVSRTPDCESFCAENTQSCKLNYTSVCRYCGC